MLRAPIAGIATQVTSIQMGRYLTAGMAVFSIIATDTVWVEANPKETDLTYVRPRPAGDDHRGRVPLARIGTARSRPSARAPARSSRILPPQNAAGNWIKVVQRVPLRIEFDPGQDLRRLRSGMSATVEIDTGRRGRSHGCSAPAPWRRTQTHDRAERARRSRASARRCSGCWSPSA